MDILLLLDISTIMRDEFTFEPFYNHIQVFVGKFILVIDICPFMNPFFVKKVIFLIRLDYLCASSNSS